MARTVLESLVLEKTLSTINTSAGGHILDLVFNGTLSLKEGSLDEHVRNVCARVHISLVEEIDQICNVLGLGKRQFIEACLLEGVTRARSIMRDEGMDEAMQTPWITSEPEQEVK